MQLPPFKLERYFAQYEFEVEHNLCASDSESLTVADLLALEPDAHDRFMTHWLGYTESLGAPSLRQAIAQVYTTIDAAQVLVHSGAEEAIFLFMSAALAAGDHVIVHTPCYQSLGEIARSVGCELTEWRAREENNWALDLDELRAAIKPNTRAVILNTPHNPTGFLMSRADFNAVCEIARQHNLILFSDEVYREAEYDPADRLPAACDRYENAVSLGVMSKTYGLPGLRIGWIATHNADLFDRMAQLKDYTTICNSAPSEFLAELALRHRQQLAQRNVDLIKRNMALLNPFIASQCFRFEWVRPKAGPIAFPRLIGENVDKFCDALVKQTGVLLLPGSVYNDTGNHFRIGYGRSKFPEGLARLEEFLSRRSQ